MYITKTYAQRLIKSGKAKKDGLVYHNGSTWMAITRFDLQRIDHYLVGQGDLRRLSNQ